MGTVRPQSSQFECAHLCDLYRDGVSPFFLLFLYVSFQRAHLTHDKLTMTLCWLKTNSQLARVSAIESCTTGQGVARPREGMTDRKVFSTLPYSWRILTIGISRRNNSCEAEFSPFVMWVDKHAAQVSEEEFAHNDQRGGLELNTRVAQSATVPCAELEHGRACACSGENFGGGRLEVSRSPRITWVPQVSEWLAWSLGCSLRSGLANMPTPCSSLQVWRVPSDSLNVEARPLQSTI